MLRVLGESGLIHVDAGRMTGRRARTELAGLKLSYLDRGDSLDLATFRPQPGPAKRRVRARERYFRAPTRVGKAAFAGYTTHETLARLVEGDPLRTIAARPPGPMSTPPAPRSRSRSAAAGAPRR